VTDTSTNLFRASLPGIEVRAADDGGMPTLFGHFAVFDRWVEIDSFWEGNFMERFARGAFKKTFRENRDGIKVLFQHGADPQIGDKPLGPVDALREDEVGGYYESRMLDTAYNRELVPGLDEGLYGASFRFRVMKELIDEEPEPSDANPRGLPERTIKEAQVFEFGPVTFPAYADASAGVRSTTDDHVFRMIAADPQRFRALAADATLIEALSADEAGAVSATSDDDESREEITEEPVTKPLPVKHYTQDDLAALAVRLTTKKGSK